MESFLPAETDDNRRPAGYLELVRNNADFRYLWTGQIVSLLGDWFNLIAAASLIAVLTESGIAVGGLFVVRSLAPFVVSPIAGVVADRYSRKRILIVADVVRAAAVLAMLLVRDAGDIWLLYTLNGLQFAVSGFFFPARSALTPDIVTRRQLGTANALSSATWSVMLGLGAATGGLVSGIWGVYTAFVLDAATFVLSALIISRIAGGRARTETRDGSVAAALRQYVDGLKYLARHADIFVIALHKSFGALLFGVTLYVVQMAIADEVFVIGQGGGTAFGLMLAAAGVGTGIGPLVVRRFTGDRDRSLRVAVLLAYLLGAAGLLITAPLTSFATVLVGCFIRGLGSGVIWVFSTQLLQQLVPSRIQGRVFATELGLFSLISAPGTALAGAALDTPLGITGLITSIAALTLIPAILWTAWLIFYRPVIRSRA